MDNTNTLEINVKTLENKIDKLDTVIETMESKVTKIVDNLSNAIKNKKKDIKISHFKKVAPPKNMFDANELVYSNLILSDHYNFQLGHAEIDKKHSFIILLRFEEGEDHGDFYKVSRMSFTLVNSFNNDPKKEHYIINAVDLTPRQDKRYEEGMINFTIKIELADKPNSELFYLNREIVFKSNNDYIDLHIKAKEIDDQGNIIWKDKNTGGHLCRSKTAKGG